MKVNISYSVALEEVLPLVEKLYKENKKEFSSAFSRAATIMESSFGDDQLDALLINIQQMRVGMIKLDTKLEECASIIDGYQKIITEPHEPPAAIADEEGEGDESITSG